jgi:hypothetical protein
MLHREEERWGGVMRPLQTLVFRCDPLKAATPFLRLSCFGERPGLRKGGPGLRHAAGTRRPAGVFATAARGEAVAFWLVSVGFFI